MKLEGIISKQFQNISGAFFKLSSRERVVYSIGTGVIALLGFYCLKSLFTFLGLSKRVTPPPAPGTPPLSDFGRQFHAVQELIKSLGADDQPLFTALIHEIKRNIKELEKNCHEDPGLMKLVYQSSINELQRLQEIAQALQKGQGAREDFDKCCKAHELRQLLGAGHPDITKIERLLQVVSPNKPMMGDPLHGTPLHYLAKKGGDPGVVFLLITQGADLNCKDTWGNTPLIWAIANGKFSMAAQMIEKAPEGADFNIMGMGNAALHLALAKGYTTKTGDGAALTVSSHDLMTLLIPCANVSLPGRKGNTPLHIACVRRDPAMIQALLRAGGDRSLKNEQGETPEAMLNKTDQDAHTFLKETAAVYLLENRASLEECQALFTIE